MANPYFLGPHNSLSPLWNFWTISKSDLGLISCINMNPITFQSSQFKEFCIFLLLRDTIYSNEISNPSDWKTSPNHVEQPPWFIIGTVHSGSIFPSVERRTKYLDIRFISPWDLGSVTISPILFTIKNFPLIIYIYNYFSKFIKFFMMIIIIII